MIAPETTIPRLLIGAAARHGERAALEDGPVTLRYAELPEAALRAARAFRASGVRVGDRVAIWAPNLWEWVIAALGLQCAGGVLVPINTRMKGAEAGQILRRSRARVLCTVGEFLGNHYLDLLEGEDLPGLETFVTFRDHDPRAMPWAEFLARAASLPEDEARRRAQAVSPEDLADLLFTSGTTGHPKGVMAAHGQNLQVYKAWSQRVGLRAGDRYLIVNPFFHSFGYKAGWLAAFLCGATVLPCAVFDVPAVLERVAREHVSVLPGPPTLYQSLLAHPERSRYDLSSLRLAVTGAAAIPVELVHRMRDELGFETVVTGYGLTEATGTVTMCHHDDDPETIATSSGCAIPGVEVRCVDDAGVEVLRGEPGEVLVRGYNVMRGYFEEPAETAAAIDAEGWLHTGDVGVMDARGYLRITDRKKDMFILGGFNCYPAEIESLMSAHGGIAQVAVIGIPDARLGEVGMAFVVPRPGAELSEESLIAWCREKMANTKVPRRIAIVGELPLNASGKVMKFALRELARAARGGEGR